MMEARPGFGPRRDPAGRARAGAAGRRAGRPQPRPVCAPSWASCSCGWTRPRSTKRRSTCGRPPRSSSGAAPARVEIGRNELAQARAHFLKGDIETAQVMSAHVHEIGLVAHHRMVAADAKALEGQALAARGLIDRGGDVPTARQCSCSDQHRLRPRGARNCGSSWRDCSRMSATSTLRATHTRAPPHRRGCEVAPDGSSRTSRSRKEALDRWGRQESAAPVTGVALREVRRTVRGNSHRGGAHAGDDCRGDCRDGELAPTSHVNSPSHRWPAD